MKKWFPTFFCENHSCPHFGHLVGPLNRESCIILKWYDWEHCFSDYLLCIKRFRVLEANAYEKLQRMLVTYLSRCTLFLVGEMPCFDDGLTHAFCFTTMAEYSKSSIKDQVYKVRHIWSVGMVIKGDLYLLIWSDFPLQFAHKICSSLFSLQETRSSHIIDLLICVLESVAHETKVILHAFTLLIFFVPFALTFLLLYNLSQKSDIDWVHELSHALVILFLTKISKLYCSVLFCTDFINLFIFLV